MTLYVSNLFMILREKYGYQQSSAIHCVSEFGIGVSAFHTARSQVKLFMLSSIDWPEYAWIQNKESLGTQCV